MSVHSFKFAPPILPSPFAVLGIAIAATLGTPTTARAQSVQLPPPSNRIFEARLADVEHPSYDEPIEALLSAFEQNAGKRLAPSVKRRAALKVYSNSGPGLSTPPGMVRAVISALERRGFEKKDLFIVGLSTSHLRACGFIPPLSEGGSTFDSVPVFALDSGQYYDPQWYYDSPLPSRISSPYETIEPEDLDLPTTAADRKSFLPAPLIFDVDFWINLPACTDHPVLGVNGALVNATLWNASNTQRFFRSPATGPAAVAEIAAIPELRAGMVCTIVSLDRYQFIGGPIFNSLYTVAEPVVWLSDNPVMIDALLRDRIDRARRATGFRVLPSELRLLTYAQQLGLGSANRSRIEWTRIPAQLTLSK